jgi:hypothetical protein
MSPIEIAEASKRYLSSKKQLAKQWPTRQLQFFLEGVKGKSVIGHQTYLLVNGLVTGFIYTILSAIVVLGPKSEHML